MFRLCGGRKKWTVRAVMFAEGCYGDSKNINFWNFCFKGSINFIVYIIILCSNVVYINM